MLRNLFLATFLFALALPALAVPLAPTITSQPAVADCHGMPMEKQGEDTKHNGKGIQLHGCIGCIAPLCPIFVMAETTALPFVPKNLAHRTLFGTMKRPSIPPPRT
jgi:hypothetical protein